MKQTSRRTLIPEDFTVSGRIVELAKENKWPDPWDELNAFKDYHIAHGTLMADWEAAFRTWLRNCLRFNKAAPVIKPVPPKPKLTREEYRLTPEERARNVRMIKELAAGIGKKI